MKKTLLALALAAALPALSSTVTVSGQVGWSCGTGNGGFESGCSPDVEYGTFGFTYDPSIADSDPDSTRGLFQGALSSFSMTVQQETRPDLHFTLAGGNSISLGMFGEHLQLNLGLMALDDALGSANIRLSVYRAQPGGLDRLPGASFWNGATAYVGSVGGVYETDWGWSFGATERETPATLASITASATPVPEPGTLTLLFAGLVAVACIRRYLPR